MKQKHHPIPEELKRKIVDEYLTTDFTQVAILERHKIRGNNIDRWIRKFAAEKGSNEPENDLLMKRKSTSQGSPIASRADLSVDEELEQLRRENAALKKALDYERLKTEALDTMINLAEEHFQIPIRKKSGARQSKS